MAPPNYTGAWDMTVVGDALWVGGYMTSVSDQEGRRVRPVHDLTAASSAARHPQAAATQRVP